MGFGCKGGKPPPPSTPLAIARLESLSVDSTSPPGPARQSGLIRCFTKRMGRLTYCFSKKWLNHETALCLYFAHYNYCRKHRTLKGHTPAMAAGLTDRVWTVRELLDAVTELRVAA